MERTKLAVGMKVYFVENGHAWERVWEDVEQAEATVVDLDRWEYPMYGGGGARTSMHGKLVHIKTPSGDRYVTPARLRGRYEDVAPARLREKKAARARELSEEATRDKRRESIAAVVQEAKNAGLHTVQPAFRDRESAFIELTAAELHALLVEVREAREGKGGESNVQGQVEGN